MLGLVLLVIDRIGVFILSILCVVKKLWMYVLSVVCWCRVVIMCVCCVGVWLVVGLVGCGCYLCSWWLGIGGVLVCCDGLFLGVFV